MIKFIEKLQKKSERERKHILLISTISLTLVVFVAWASSFYLSVSKLDGLTAEATPFQSLKESIGSAAESFNFSQ